MILQVAEHFALGTIVLHATGKHPNTVTLADKKGTMVSGLITITV